MSAVSWRRDIDISSHLTHDELALLAEGRAGDAAERFRHHLTHCKGCFQAYQDAVEFRARSLAGQEPPAPPELLQNGRKVPFRRSRGRTRSVRTILVTVTAVVALGATWIFFGPGRIEKSSLGRDDVAVLRDLSAQASEQGLVFPEASEGKKGPLYRTGEVGSSPEVQRIVERLQGLAKEGKATPDDLFWLASAELATGNLDMARFYLQQAPDASDVRFLKLKAILAYRESRLTDAEQNLRAVLEQHPSDAQAEFNLGLVLAESGKAPEALKWLQRAHESNEARIVRRASNVLDSLSP